MKFKALAVLCFFVLGLFVIVVFNSDNRGVGLKSSSGLVWQQMEGKIKGLNWSRKLRSGVDQKFNELQMLLYLHHTKNPDDMSIERMAYLLERQGTIIEIEENEHYITGYDEILAFLKMHAKKSITLEKMNLVDVGFLNRLVDGHEVGHYAKVEFTIKVVESTGGEVVENHDYDASMILMHRHNCPWDG